MAAAIERRFEIVYWSVEYRQRRSTLSRDQSSDAIRVATSSGGDVMEEGGPASRGEGPRSMPTPRKWVFDLGVGLEFREAPAMR